MRSADRDRCSSDRQALMDSLFESLHRQNGEQRNASEDICAGSKCAFYGTVSNHRNRSATNVGTCSFGRLENKRAPLATVYVSSSLCPDTEKKGIKS